MKTIAIKTNTEIMYHQLYEWFADFVWDLFDDTKGKERTVSLPYIEIKNAGKKILQFLIRNIFSVIEVCILYYLPLVVKVKKVSKKDIKETKQTLSSWLNQGQKRFILTIRSILAKSYKPGFDSYMVLNTC